VAVDGVVALIVLLAATPGVVPQPRLPTGGLKLVVGLRYTFK
jgi:hypothetical protein